MERQSKMTTPFKCPAKFVKRILCSLKLSTTYAAKLSSACWESPNWESGSITKQDWDALAKGVESAQIPSTDGFSYTSKRFFETMLPEDSNDLIAIDPPDMYGMIVTYTMLQLGLTAKTLGVSQDNHPDQAILSHCKSKLKSIKRGRGLKDTLMGEGPTASEEEMEEEIRQERARKQPQFAKPLSSESEDDCPSPLPPPKKRTSTSASLRTDRSAKAPRQAPSGSSSDDLRDHLPPYPKVDRNKQRERAEPKDEISIKLHDPIVVNKNYYNETNL